MNNYALLHFEYKNDATIIIKLHKATRLLLVALYKILIMMVTSYYAQNVIEHRKLFMK